MKNLKSLGLKIKEVKKFVYTGFLAPNSLSLVMRMSFNLQIQGVYLSHDRFISSFRERERRVKLSLLHCAKLLQLCPTLCNPVDCRPSGSSVDGILQARILEWVAVPSSRGSSQPRDWTRIFMSPALAEGFFTTSITWEDSCIGSSLSSFNSK